MPRLLSGWPGRHAVKVNGVPSIHFQTPSAFSLVAPSQKEPLIATDRMKNHVGLSGTIASCPPRVAHRCLAMSQDVCSRYTRYHFPLNGLASEGTPCAPGGGSAAGAGRTVRTEVMAQ